MEHMIGRNWGKALKLNKTLIHIDLSSNDFSSEACKFIGKRLKKNHTLYGVHMHGNACSVDSFGFF
jgi:hypothetical protein